MPGKKKKRNDNKNKSKPDAFPFVSVCTPTFNRRPFFNMIINCFKSQTYPLDKLEWVIIDDGTDKIEDLVKDIPQVKYFYYEDKMSLGEKRNIMHDKSKGDIIVYMDDDDYYPPESVLARVKVLLKYREKGIKCVGCTQIGTYNIINNMSSMSSDGPINFSEASMAYTKDFWNERRFDNTAKVGEHKYFTETRLNQIIDIPYSFVIIAINHKNNFTAGLRSVTQNKIKNSSDNENANFFDTWDVETQMFMLDMKKYLTKG